MSVHADLLTLIYCFSTESYTRHLSGLKSVCLNAVLKAVLILNDQIKQSVVSQKI